jgi:methylated-DNA-[protein]-cysteine S-methyltransferase
MTYYTILKTKTVGNLLLMANDTDLIGLYYRDSDGAPGIKSHWVRKPRQPVLAAAVRQMKEYFKGMRKTFTVPIHFDGTEFQEKIWAHTARISYGQTVSYSELAHRAGVPLAVRATGTALSNNQIDIIIPAHRVISKSGGTGGFSGNWNRKVRLLELEKPRPPEKKRKVSRTHHERTVK